MDELEKRVALLEFQTVLLTGFIDPDINPFIFLVLESAMTEAQMNSIYDLMEEVANGILNGNPMNHAEFEEKVYVIFPSQRGDYHFAESIVRTLKDRSRWERIYDHMKDSGMNLE